MKELVIITLGFIFLCMLKDCITKLFPNMRLLRAEEELAEAKLNSIRWINRSNKIATIIATVIVYLPILLALGYSIYNL